MVIVSHDREFLDQVGGRCTEAQGGVGSQDTGPGWGLGGGGGNSVSSSASSAPAAAAAAAHRAPPLAPPAPAPAVHQDCGDGARRQLHLQGCAAAPAGLRRSAQRPVAAALLPLPPLARRPHLLPSPPCPRASLPPVLPQATTPST